MATAAGSNGNRDGVSLIGTISDNDIVISGSRNDGTTTTKTKECISMIKRCRRNNTYSKNNEPLNDAESICKAMTQSGGRFVAKDVDEEDKWRVLEIEMAVEHLIWLLVQDEWDGKCIQAKYACWKPWKTMSFQEDSPIKSLREYFNCEEMSYWLMKRARNNQLSDFVFEFLDPPLRTMVSIAVMKAMEQGIERFPIG